MGCPISELGREKRVVKSLRQSPAQKTRGHFAGAEILGTYS
jgi:hypothetical protein